jgi:hypothetical protein
MQHHLAKRRIGGVAVGFPRRGVGIDFQGPGLHHAIDRAANRKDQAVRDLREAQTRYGPIPETEALKGWLDILDPPPPPPTPAKATAGKS